MNKTRPFPMFKYFKLFFNFYYDNLPITPMNIIRDQIIGTKIK
jgi:hypothetical protein